MLIIDDIRETEELDRDAMKIVEGGAFYTSAKSRFVELESHDRGIIKKTQVWAFL